MWDASKAERTTEMDVKGWRRLHLPKRPGNEACRRSDLHVYPSHLVTNSVSLSAVEEAVNSWNHEGSGLRHRCSSSNNNSSSSSSSSSISSSSNGNNPEGQQVSQRARTSMTVFGLYCSRPVRALEGMPANAGEPSPDKKHSPKGRTVLGLRIQRQR